MNSLGIYFGPKVITLVETKGRKVLNTGQISRLALSPSELEEKVPDQIKMVALFKDELRKNKIEANQASIAFSGKDLVIRTFDLPAFLPREELFNAVNFEVRKYIPFKVEDLISDFQVQFDKLNRNKIILFVGIKKETLDHHFAILNELNIKVNAIEYAGFSILRFTRLARLSDKGIAGVITADLQEEDETNFTILEDDFPLFSRDINLTGGLEDFMKTAGIEPGTKLEKLKTELRISLDYYNRKFPVKNIKKIFLISNKECFLELEVFLKEMGFLVQFIEVTRLMGKPIPFSLGLVKAYGCSLAKTIKGNLKINLLAAKAMLAPKSEMKLELAALLADIRIDPRIVFVLLAICIFPFLFGRYHSLPLQKELKSIMDMRPRVSAVGVDASYDRLTAVEHDYKEKIDTLYELVKKQLYLTETLDAIPRVVPLGMWLTDFNFQKQEDKAELSLTGIAYLEDSDKELQLINAFALALEKEPNFNKYFKNIKIVSIDHSQIKEAPVTNFLISCRKE